MYISSFATRISLYHVCGPYLKIHLKTASTVEKVKDASFKTVTNCNLNTRKLSQATI